MHPSLALRMVRPTGRMMKEAGKPNDFMSKVKAVPVELWPLAGVVGVALGCGGYAIYSKFAFDKTLRLSRQGPALRTEDQEKH